MALSGGGGGGGSSKSVRAGRAFVELGVDNTLLERGLNAASARLKSFGGKLAGGGGVLMGLGASVLGPAVAAVGEMLNHFGDMQDAADRLSSTPEIVSAIGYAADQSGASLEDVEVGVKSLYRALVAQGKTAGPLDQELLNLADQLDAIEDPAAKSAKAMEMLGKSGMKLLPMLKGGSAGLGALFSKAGAVGDIVSSEDAERAERAGDAISDVWKSIKNTVRTAAAAALPFIQTIEQLSRQVVMAGGAVREWIKNNSALIVGLTAGAAALMAIGAAGVVAGAGITAAGLAISAASTLVGLLATPLGVAALLVGGLTAAFLTLTPQGRSTAKAIAGYFEESAATFNTTWGGITDALKSGDLALAGEIAMAGLNVEMLRGQAKLLEGWSAFGEHFVEAWHAALYLVQQSTIDVMEKMQSVFGQKWSAMLRIQAAAIGLVDSKMADNLRFIADANESDPQRLKKAFTLAGIATKKEADAEEEKRNKERQAKIAAEQAKIDAATAKLGALRAQAARGAGGVEVAPMPRGLPGLPGLGALGGAAGGFTLAELTQSMQKAANNPVVKAVEKGNGKLDDIREAIEDLDLQPRLR